MSTYSISQWLLVFFFYSFVGWVWECVYVSLQKHRWVNRGFMHGPMLPLYGFGALIMLIVTIPVRDNLVLIFLFGMIGCTVLEFCTGAVMQKLFHVRYWDYSDQKFNIKGHICPGASLIWGIFTILMVKVIHIPVENVLLSIPDVICDGAAFLLLAAGAADFTQSFNEAMDLKRVLVQLEEAKEKLEAAQEHLRDAAEKNQERMQQAAQENRQKMQSALAQNRERMQDDRVRRQQAAQENKELLVLSAAEVRERLKVSSEELQEQLKASSEELQEQLKASSEELQRHLQNSAEELREHLQDSAEELRENLQKPSEAAKHKLQLSQEETQERIRRAMEDVQDRFRMSEREKLKKGNLTQEEIQEFMRTSWEEIQRFLKSSHEDIQEFIRDSSVTVRENMRQDISEMKARRDKGYVNARRQLRRNPKAVSDEYREALEELKRDAEDDTDQSE